MDKVSFGVNCVLDGQMKVVDNYSGLMCLPKLSCDNCEFSDGELTKCEKTQFSDRIIAKLQETNPELFL